MDSLRDFTRMTLFTALKLDESDMTLRSDLYIDFAVGGILAILRRWPELREMNVAQTLYDDDIAAMAIGLYLSMSGRGARLVEAHLPPPRGGWARGPVEAAPRCPSGFLPTTADHHEQDHAHGGGHRDYRNRRYDAGAGVRYCLRRLRGIRVPTVRLRRIRRAGGVRRARRVRGVR